MIIWINPAIYLPRKKSACTRYRNGGCCEYLRRIFLYYWNSEEYQCKKECHITWGNAEKEDYAKIEEVLASYEFFQYQIEVFRRNYSNPAEESMTLYPYYIITDNCMLLFSRDGKNCVQITNEDNIQAGRKLYYDGRRL